jgi:hypothetical protein
MSVSPARRAALQRLVMVALGATLLSTTAASRQLTPPPGIDVVGELRVEVPSESPFLLHGTLPLPRKTWINADAVAPFLVVNHDGWPVLTQTEAVTRYPRHGDGVAVGEVIAYVTRPPGAKPGDEVSYRIVHLNHNVPPTPAPTLKALTNGPIAVPAAVKELIDSPQGLGIEAYDVFGNRYQAAPFSGEGELEILRHGWLRTQLRISTTLVPSPPVSGPTGTLPHHLGVHVYVTVSAADDVIGLDLRFHNGHSGKDPATTLDDPLGTVYFRSIELVAPSQWSFVQDYDDPFVGDPVAQGDGTTAFPLVKPCADGKVHGMQWQAQFHRRLSLVPNAKVALGRERARGAGLGFATRGVSEFTGNPLWSWWNAETARWYPQSHQLPSLAHVGDAVLDQVLAKDLASVQGPLEAGTGGGYPIGSGVLGHAHPYGVPYGGMTGGAGIYVNDGMLMLEQASLAGYQTTRIRHRMNSDRQPSVLYDADGTPSTVEDWLVTAEDGTEYVPFSYFQVPSIKPGDPFGLDEAPTFQQDHVQANGLAAPHLTELFSYAPHDFQHLIRYTGNAKVLAWAANDSLAQDDLLMQVEAFGLSYHQYFNSKYQYLQSTGLRFDQQYVEEHGPVGFSIGRGEGWGLDAAVAAYAGGTPAWRAQKRAWLDALMDVVADGQAACSGFIQSQAAPKFEDGKYRCRQMIEQSILENALVGLLETVYRGEDVARTALLEDVITDSTYSMLDPLAWGPGQSGPWAVSANAPGDESLPPWCDLSQVPADGHTDYTDTFQNWSSFAYGYERTGDPVFLEYAKVQQQAGDLLTALLGKALDNLENKAALLALMQSLEGVGL